MLHTNSVLSCRYAKNRRLSATEKQEVSHLKAANASSVAIASVFRRCGKAVTTKDVTNASSGPESTMSSEMFEEWLNDIRTSGGLVCTKVR